MTATVDTSKFEAALKRIDFTGNDLLQIEGAGAAVQINGQKMRVAKDTTATQQSVSSHITKNDGNVIEDEIGPETDYAPWLEYGTGELAEKGDGRKGGWSYQDTNGEWHHTHGMKAQPFVRPTAQEDFNKTIDAMQAALNMTLVKKWPK
jgi:HK97 gp10 family phage protein